MLPTTRPSTDQFWSGCAWDWVSVAPWECFARESLIQSPAQLETAIKKKEKQQQKQKLRIFHLSQNAVEFSRGNL